MSANPRDVGPTLDPEDPTGPGSQLREARHRANLSVEEVATQLRLDRRTVRALEEGDFQHLPAPTFIRGYIRSYARLLGLPPGPILEAYDFQGFTPPAILADISQRPQARVSDIPVRLATYLVAAGLVLMVVMWWHSRESAPPPEAEPMAAAPTEIPVAGSTDGESPGAAPPAPLDPPQAPPLSRTAPADADDSELPEPAAAPPDPEPLRSAAAPSAPSPAGLEAPPASARPAGPDTTVTDTEAGDTFVPGGGDARVAEASSPSSPDETAAPPVSPPRSRGRPSPGPGTSAASTCISIKNPGSRSTTRTACGTCSSWRRRATISPRTARHRSTCFWVMPRAPPSASRAGSTTSADISAATPPASSSVRTAWRKRRPHRRKNPSPRSRRRRSPSPSPEPPPARRTERSRAEAGRNLLESAPQSASLPGRLEHRQAFALRSPHPVMKTIKAIRGMNDISPAEVPYWQLFEHTARAVLGAYGYQEMRPPVVERTELFRRSVGESTDIVEKEMYTFEDRSGESLTLRPECTASCVRAAVEHGWLRSGGVRIWHIGPMFRYERPQKGRYRQFHQLDVEALGFPGADVDAELILLSARIWKRLGLKNIRLELNSLGSREAQSAYRNTLVTYFSDHRAALDEDSLRRLETNPLRILDSKNPEMQSLIDEAPAPVDHLDAASSQHFEALKSYLGEAGIEFHINRRLVRGLDYYTGTVFEWTTQELGAQNAVCGGGRYDGLVAEIGGADTPATGFALGIERLVALLKIQSIEPAASAPHAYLAAVGDRAAPAALSLAERMRDEMPELRLLVDAGGGGFRGKLKRADRSLARVALVLGEDEVDSETVGVKDLRGDAPQSTINQKDIVGFLRGLGLN